MNFFAKINLKKNKKGFTLVEVIVVLVILAILAAVLIPSLIGYIDKANEKQIISEAREAYTAAQVAISEVYSTKSADFATAAKHTYTDPFTGEKISNIGIIEDRFFYCSQFEKTVDNKLSPFILEITKEVLNYINSSDKSNAEYKWSAKHNDTANNQMYASPYKIPTRKISEYLAAVKDTTASITIVYDAKGNILLLEYGRYDMLVSMNKTQAKVVKDGYPSEMTWAKSQ